MILSRNWLNEFVDLKDITDKQFNDDMTLSGSKVETIERQKRGRGQDPLHGKAPRQRPHVGLPDRRRSG